MPELSIIIPGRKERYLAQTCADVLAHIEADTELIAVIDGEAAGPDPAPDPRLRVIRLAEAVGQRAAQNLGVRNSRARWVMKLDAHCAVEQGFDRKLLAVAEPDMTLVPVMRNLHIYNWVCQFCGAAEYQGPKPAQCKECEGTNFDEVLVWNPKPNPQSSAYRFNKSLQFKYFGELRQQQGHTGLQETMSLQGSCFMTARDVYWDKELCDEKWGSWGQQGSEVALKTWLSGGRVLCLRDTWYAHLFRTKGGDALQYPGVHDSQENARAMSKDIFLNDAWPKQTRPLAWLLDKFWQPLMRVGDPEARWEQSDLDQLRARSFRVDGKPYVRPVTKGAIYYTDNQLDEAIARPVRERLISISKAKNLPITTAALKRRQDWGAVNKVLPSLKRGPLAMFKQILCALEHSRADVIFFCEHDVLYTPEHFDFTPPERDKVYYNLSLWQVRYPDGQAVYWDAKRVSQLCGYRDTLLAHYRKRLELVEAHGYSMAMGYEPGSHNRAERVDDLKSDVWRTATPNLDIKHGGNLSPTKWALSDFRTAPTGWEARSAAPGWPPLWEVLGVEHAQIVARPLANEAVYAVGAD